jgi:hypothetical protein
MADVVRAALIQQKGTGDKHSMVKNAVTALGEAVARGARVATQMTLFGATLTRPGRPIPPRIAAGRRALSLTFAVTYSSVMPGPRTRCGLAKLAARIPHRTIPRSTSGPRGRASSCRSQIHEPSPWGNTKGGLRVLSASVR